jgi:hypothetical protein
MYSIHFLFIAVFISAKTALAWEPVSALDDGFAIPSPGMLAESGMSFPGCESLIRSPYAVMAWQEPFGMRDLAVTTVHAGASAGNAAASISFSGSGFDLYGDEQEKFGLSYLLHDGLSAGIRITRSAMRIKNFGDSSAFGADAGLVCQPFKTVVLAVSVEDLFGATMGDSREPLDGAQRFSAAWNALEGFTVLGSMRNVRRFGTSFSAGFVTDVAGPLTIGACGGTEPDRIDFLAAVTLGGLRFAYWGSWHRDLGMSHGGSLVWGERE